MMGHEVFEKVLVANRAEIAVSVRQLNLVHERLLFSRKKTETPNTGLKPMRLT